MTKLTTEQFIEKARKIHGDKYDYSKVEYEHSKKGVEIICPQHGSFKIKPNNHLNGQGCSSCGKTKKLTVEEFITKSKVVHGDKYDYSKVKYVNSKTNVIITCPKHGDFEITPNHHMRGVGCKKCHFEKLSTMNSLTEEEFLERANKIHHGKYMYGKYNGYEKKMQIFCKKHGEFLQTPHMHLSGGGCKKCAFEKQHEERTKGFDKFVEEANEIHNKKYSYIPPYVNKNTPIRIVCQTHGVFEQTPKLHLKGCGCPICKASHLENKILIFLNANNLEYVYQCNNKTLKWLNRQHLDFYLPKHGIAIECQGEQHFYPSNFGSKEKDPNVCLKTIQERDERKRKLCEEHGIKLLYFSDKKYSDEIITDKEKLLEIVRGK